MIHRNLHIDKIHKSKIYILNKFVFMIIYYRMKVARFSKPTQECDKRSPTTQFIDNLNNNNQRTHDQIKEEDEFWAQPEEGDFYIPLPMPGLLPFVNPSDDDLSTDAIWLFGDEGKIIEQRWIQDGF